MGDRPLNLDGIMNLEMWQKIQDELAYILGVAIVTVDYKGIPKTKHSNCSNFCRIIRNNPKIGKSCERCDSRGGLEAVRINGPYIYKCHCGIVDVAVPIIAYEKYIGAIMFGQILLDAEHDKFLEKIFVDPNVSSIIDDEELLSEYKKIQVFELSKIQTIASLIQNICNYVVNEALNKHLVYNFLDGYIKDNNDKKAREESENITIVDLLKNKITASIREANLEDLNIENNVKANSMIAPAIEYIHQNKNKFVKLENAARLCHLNPSYFSRLFKKEMGKNFSSYVSSTKILMAKQLLENTNLPISQISDDLGYNDVGYFIKQFKKIEGTTPTLFRKRIK